MTRLQFLLLAGSLAACATDPSGPYDIGVGGDDKADNPARRVEVSVDECGPGGLCPYVQSASCGLVTLHDSHDKQIAKAFSSNGGRVTFSNVPAGEYTVKVHNSDNTLASMFVSDYSDDTAPAKIKVKVGSAAAEDGDNWARFNLPDGTAKAISQCAGVRGNITVTDSHGTALDRHAAEWQWFVQLDRDGGETDTSRLLFIYPDSNIVNFFDVPKGTNTLRYIRMDIPSYEQRNNPDYERLLRDYATDQPPIEVSVSVGSAQFGTTVDVSRKIVDPLAH